VWRPDTAYNAQDLVVPIAYIGWAFRAQNSGLSADFEPPWPTVVGGTVTDFGITWKAEPEVLCGVVLNSQGQIDTSKIGPLPTLDRGFDNPQADFDSTLVSTGREIFISYKRADLYSLPPVYSTATGNPPWGSQPNNSDNDADGEVDPVSIADRHNQGAFAAVFNSDTANQFAQQFPNDAWAEPSHPLRHPVPCSVYTDDCGGIAKFDGAAPNDSSGSVYAPYPVGTPPPSESSWPVIPFPRDWPPFRDADQNSVPMIKRLLRMASSIVSFDSTQSHMSEYHLEESARNVVTTAPGTPLAGALRDAYNYFVNSVFPQTDDPSINCRDYKIIFVTDGIDSADADPCTGGSNGTGPAGDLGTVALPESVSGARAAAHAVDSTIRTAGIPVFVVALGTPDPNNQFNKLQCIADNSGGSVQFASNVDSLRQAIKSLLKGNASANSFAAPALPAIASGIGDSAQIAAVVPSHVNEDASLSQWALWNGSLKSFALDSNGNIPVVGVTPTGTPAPTATPAPTTTPAPTATAGVTTVAGPPDESHPDDADPTTRRPVWNAARVLGYTDPAANLDEGLDPLAAVPDSKAPAIVVWPGRKMVWATGSAPIVPLTRQDFNCPPDGDVTPCPSALITAMGLDPTSADDQKKAKRAVEFLRGGKSSYGSRDEILTDFGGENPDTYGVVFENTKFSYYYQDDQPPPGSPQVRTDGEAVPHGYPHKLGDIFHSEPAVLLPPKYFQFLSANVTPRTGACGLLPDCSYGAFASLHSKRRRVVFAGANDGFLHAFDLGVFGRDDGGTGAFSGTFDLGTGREIFAYAPKAVMNPGFASLIAFPPPAPQYFVDGSVTLADVFIDTSHAGVPTPNDRTWKSVLVGSLRQGGKYYYALDVTQPDKIDTTTGEKTAGKDTSPDCLNGTGNCPDTYPSVLWELTDDCAVDATTCVSNPPAMGETWSRPVVGRIKIGSGSGSEDRYVAMFGGGFDQSFTPGTEVLSTDTTTRGRAFYIVNVETGKILYKASQGLDDASSPVLFAPMPAPPAAADVDDDGYLDILYIGDLNGRMWRIDLTQGSCQNCGSTSETLTGFQPFLLYDSKASSTQPIQPIFYDAGIIFISGGVPPTLGVAFGSGNRADLVHSDGTHVNRFVLVRDAGAGKTFHDTDLVNLTPTGGVTSAGNGPAPTTAGYYLDFATFTEKTISTVFSTLGNLSVLTFSSDSANTCSPGGTSFRYRFNFATGQGGYAASLPVPGQPGSLADYRESLGSGLAMAAQSQATNGDMIDTVLMSGGELNQQTTPGSLKTISQSWKEQ
jgi:hypothetical protein